MIEKSEKDIEPNGIIMEQKIVKRLVKNYTYAGKSIKQLTEWSIEAIIKFSEQFARFEMQFQGAGSWRPASKWTFDENNAHGFTFNENNMYSFKYHYKDTIDENWCVPKLFKPALIKIQMHNLTKNLTKKFNPNDFIKLRCRETNETWWYRPFYFLFMAENGYTVVIDEEGYRYIFKYVEPWEIQEPKKHTMLKGDIVNDIDKISYLEEKVLRLEFMVENGLGENDMHDDTKGDVI